jgi:SAM-dependent methyltransferase
MNNKDKTNNVSTMIRTNIYEDFSKIGPHFLMLQDRTRTGSYVKAIQETVKPGDTVLDIGCGTGIFSIISAQAGAGKVYAVEMTDIIHTAEEIAKINNVGDRVLFIKNDLRNVSLEEKADVIITETIGPFVMEEGIVEIVKFARDNFLKPGGKIIPEKVDLYVAPHSDKTLFDRLQEYTGFWKNGVYGLDFSPCVELISEEFLHKPYNWNIEEGFLCDKPKIVKKLNLYEEVETDFENEVVFTLKPRSAVYGFAGFFDVKLSEKTGFNTLPGSPLTHWMYPLFSLDEPMFPNDELTLGIRYEDKDKMWYLSATSK